MKALVIGASGQVGAGLFRAWGRRGQVAGTCCTQSAPGLRRLHLANLLEVESLLEETRPDVCFLPAALTHLDYAETHPEDCHAVNVEGPRRVARVLNRLGGVLVFFSTDHVFGDRPAPCREEDEKRPLSAYARGKALAEELIAAELPERHLILRTSCVFGPDSQGKNFAYRVRRSLEEGVPLVVASDQMGQPTYGPDLSEAAVELVRRDARGVFHVVGPESLTRLEWARRIASALGFWGQSLLGQETASLGAAAPRPLRVQLDRRKLLDFLGRDPIRSLDAGLRALAREWDHEATRRAAA